MKNILNIITAISLTVCLLTACMLDSPSLIPVAVCAGSVAVMTTACVFKEWLYGIR